MNRACEHKGSIQFALNRFEAVGIGYSALYVSESSGGAERLVQTFTLRSTVLQTSSDQRSKLWAEVMQDGNWPKQVSRRFFRKRNTVTQKKPDFCY